MTKKNLFAESLAKMVDESLVEMHLQAKLKSKSIQEDPAMVDVGKEMESNYLVRDIMTTLGEDHKLHKEIMAAMEGTSDPAELDTYREAIRLIVQTIDEKTKMVQILSKSKAGMPESKNLLAKAIREAVEQVMTEKAPPGLEDMVLSLKKKFGEDSPRPFQIAWAHYNKTKGK